MSAPFSKIATTSIGQFKMAKEEYPAWPARFANLLSIFRGKNVPKGCFVANLFVSTSNIAS